MKANSAVDLENVALSIEDLKKVTIVRNALCHGTWGLPDADGASIPFFIDRRSQRFDDKVDVAFLDQVRRHVLELAVAVVNSVTGMGWAATANRYGQKMRETDKREAAAFSCGG